MFDVVLGQKPARLQFVAANRRHLRGVSLNLRINEVASEFQAAAHIHGSANRFGVVARSLYGFHVGDVKVLAFLILDQVVERRDHRRHAAYGHDIRAEIENLSGNVVVEARDDGNDRDHGHHANDDSEQRQE